MWPAVCRVMTSAKPNLKAKTTWPGGNTGLRLPAPRQAHSPSGHAGTYGDCSNSAGISPPLTGARPGRRCPHFILQGRYSEVLAKICTHGRRPENTIDCVTAAAWLSCELPHRHRPKPPRARLRNRWDGRGRYAPNLQRRRQIPLPRRPHGSDLPPLGR